MLNKKKIKDIKKPSNVKMISWNAPRFIEYRRGLWWYLTTSLIAVALAGFFLWQKGYLSAGVVVLAAIVFFLLAREKAESVRYIINNEGLTIKDATYPFGDFKSFWMTENPLGADLHLETTNKLLPHTTIYLWRVDHEEVREFLKRYLPEMENRKMPLHEQVSRILRF